MITRETAGVSPRSSPLGTFPPRETRDETPGGGGGGYSSEFWIGVCREGS